MRVYLNGKTWDKEAICALLDRNDQAVARALMVIYNNQTRDEQAAGVTVHANGVGFTGRDADWLSDIARKWLRYGRWASEKQCNAVRRSIKKYHRQLLADMAAKEGARVLRKGETIEPAHVAPEIAPEQAPAGFGRF